jgi:hypothetical protein
MDRMDGIFDAENLKSRDGVSGWRESGFGSPGWRGNLDLTAKGRERDAKFERQGKENHGIHGTHGKGAQGFLSPKAVQ